MVKAGLYTRSDATRLESGTVGIPQEHRYYEILVEKMQNTPQVRNLYIRLANSRWQHTMRVHSAVLRVASLITF